MTLCNLDLWLHDLEKLLISITCHRELLRQVWWRSLNFLDILCKQNFTAWPYVTLTLNYLERYCINKLFQHDIMWPWPLTPQPWKPNPSCHIWWGMMSGLVKILQLPIEILCKQTSDWWMNACMHEHMYRRTTRKTLCLQPPPTVSRGIKGLYLK